MFKLNGVHLKHCKNTADVAPFRMGTPKKVVIPMSMHIGAPAKPIVKAGDEVKVGQLVGEPGAGLSSPIYSGVSGTVKKIDELITVSGAHITTVVIEPDGLQTVHEDVKPPVVENREQFLDAVRKSGIVGLGGAGFPTVVKLSADTSKIDAVVVNGAECEPYITSDTRTMLDEPDVIVDGLKMLMEYLDVKKVVIGIENNKKKCISALKRAIRGINGIQIKALPAVYPQGGEKVLVYHTVGRVIKEGQLPIDAGVIVINCTTVAAIAKYVMTGMPLVEKCVTVDGSAISEPKNVIAPIGTPALELIEFCGGFKTQPRKILWGGPMMGIALPDLNMPVMKQTNAILAFDRKDATPPEETACIKCGQCISHCPLRLSPTDINKAYSAKDKEALQKLKVNLCMECGSCSYVCPAKKNLVQTNKLAKAMLRNGGK
ncbi:MAG: electron transport complex subunit RsxC [Ruminococcaceae bacterium]|nr:electron transport complex subunit RsxC [Oscillospiraceae bacterium]